MDRGLSSGRYDRQNSFSGGRNDRQNSFGGRGKFLKAKTQRGSYLH